MIKQSHSHELGPWRVVRNPRCRVRRGTAPSQHAAGSRGDTDGSKGDTRTGGGNRRSSS
jgi:hypothetical protein